MAFKNTFFILYAFIISKVCIVYIIYYIINTLYITSNGFQLQIKTESKYNKLSKLNNNYRIYNKNHIIENKVIK